MAILGLLSSAGRVQGRLRRLESSSMRGDTAGWALTRAGVACLQCGMDKPRSITLNLRVTPEVHAVLSTIALDERRPLANLLTKLVDEALAARQAREKGAT